MLVHSDAGILNGISVQGILHCSSILHQINLSRIQSSKDHKVYFLSKYCWQKGNRHKCVLHRSLASQFCSFSSAKWFFLATSSLPNHSCEYSSLKVKNHRSGPSYRTLAGCHSCWQKRLQEARIWIKDKRHICCVLWRTNAEYKICLIAELIISLKSKCCFSALLPPSLSCLLLSVRK